MEFIILFALAIIPAKIAEKKGRDFWIWYVYGCLLLIFALIHSIVMKSKYICPHCRCDIDKEATVCPHCLRDIKQDIIQSFQL